MNIKTSDPVIVFVLIGIVSVSIVVSFAAIGMVHIWMDLRAWGLPL